MTRVLIVDDHPLVRLGLRDTVRADRAIDVVGEAGTVAEALAALRLQPCDVVLLDVALPDRGGLDALADIRREFPQVRVLIVSAHQEPQYVLRAIQRGAAGYLTKHAAPEDLLDALRAVIETGSYLPPDVVLAVAQYTQRHACMYADAQLSGRELEVLRALIGGHTVTEIAGQMSLSVKTVSTYRARLFAKLGVQTTAELVRYAAEHNLTSRR